MSADGLRVESHMKLRIWNRNIVGTQFGGGLYAMVDPICMMVLMRQLGPDYVVWDKAATIRFRRPGMGDVRAEFSLTAEEIAALRHTADTLERVEPTYTVRVLDSEQRLVAEVEKLLFVQRRALYVARA